MRATLILLLSLVIGTELSAQPPDASLYYHHGGRRYPMAPGANGVGPYIDAQNEALRRQVESALQAAILSTRPPEIKIALPTGTTLSTSDTEQFRWLQDVTSRLTEGDDRAQVLGLGKKPLEAMTKRDLFGVVDSVDGYLKALGSEYDADPAKARRIQATLAGTFVDGEGLVFGLPDAPAPVALLSHWSSSVGRSVRHGLNRLMVTRQVIEGEYRLYCQKKGAAACAEMGKSVAGFRRHYDELALSFQLAERLALSGKNEPGELMQALDHAADRLYGFAKGVYGSALDSVEAVKGLAEGTYRLAARYAADPAWAAETVIHGLSEGIRNSPRAFQALKSVVAGQWEKLLHGTPLEQGEVLGRATTEVFTTVIPALKGAKALAVGTLVETGGYRLIHGATRRLSTTVALTEKTILAVEAGTLPAAVGRPLREVAKVLPETTRVTWAESVEAVGELATKTKGLKDAGPEARRLLGHMDQAIAKQPLKGLPAKIAEYAPSEAFAKELLAYGKREGLNAGRLAHLAEFEHGVTTFMKRDSYVTYVEKASELRGSRGAEEVFVTSRRAADRLVERAGGKASILEKALGFPEGTLVNQQVVRVDIPLRFSEKPRLPSGFEPGANRLFVFGGSTSGGMPEIILQKPSTAGMKVTELGEFK